MATNETMMMDTIFSTLSDDAIEYAILEAAANKDWDLVAILSR